MKQIDDLIKALERAQKGLEDLREDLEADGLEVRLEACELASEEDEEAGQDIHFPVFYEIVGITQMGCMGVPMLEVRLLPGQGFERRLEDSEGEEV